ncbi:MAG: HAMP domain-containing protein, partial [Desulfuromonadaceae bacterium]
MSDLADILKSLAEGRIPDTVPEDCEHGEQVRALVNYLEQLSQFVGALARGDLDAGLRLPGRMAGNLKGLHANLRHLSWQTQQVADGDFSQRVEFLGGFSEAFNSMV